MAKDPCALANGLPTGEDGISAKSATETLRADERPEWWGSDEWSTPINVFDRIAQVYGPFDLDACCREETAKAQLYYTKEHDGLEREWHGRVWVNPPYSDPRPWIKKAVESVRQGDAQRVVMLLPAATDTSWFHDLVLPHADVVFVKGRIRFIGWQGTPIGSPKAGSIIAVFPKIGQALSLEGTR